MAVRFNDFRGIDARFDSTATECGKSTGGHPIRKGDHIGYARTRSGSHTVCADCWHQWQAENAEADLLERSQSYSY